MKRQTASIGVFCSASDRVNGSYRAAAEEFGRLLGEGKNRLVYGGTMNGLMGTLAQATLKYGGSITGVVPRAFRLGAREEDIHVSDLHERLSVISHNSDGFAALAGGLGTLHEVVDVLAARQAGIHRKPIVLVNTEGFYEHFREHLALLRTRGFISDPIDELYFIASDAMDAYDYLMRNISDSTSSSPIIGR